MWVLSCSAHSCLRVRTPDSPASRAAQVLGASPPTGDVAPRPVTTTRVALICWFTSCGHAGRWWLLASSLVMGVTDIGNRSGRPTPGRVTDIGRCRGRSAGLGALDEGDGV